MPKLTPIIIGLYCVACRGDYGIIGTQEIKAQGVSSCLCSLNLTFTEHRRKFDSEAGTWFSQLTYGRQRAIPESCYQLIGMPMQRLNFFITTVAKHNTGSITELYFDSRFQHFEDLELLKGENKFGPLEISKWVGLLDSFQEIKVIVHYPDINTGTSERPSDFTVYVGDKFGTE